MRKNIKKNVGVPLKWRFLKPRTLKSGKIKHYMQITHQAHKVYRAPHFESSVGIHVTSVSSPDYHRISKTIFLRGSYASMDNRRLKIYEEELTDVLKTLEEYLFFLQKVS
jgi:hypothetical protein